MAFEDQQMDLNTVVPGQALHSFSPRFTNLCAGYILGFAFCLGGGMGAAFSIKRCLVTPNSLISTCVEVAIAVAVLVGGLFLTWWVIRYASHRVTIHEYGFTYTFWRTTEIVRWGNVVQIDEVFTKQELPILKIPGVGLKCLDISFVVHQADGKKF